MNCAKALYQNPMSYLYHYLPKLNSLKFLEMAWTTHPPFEPMSVNTMFLPINHSSSIVTFCDFQV